MKGKRRDPPILRSRVIETGSAYLRIVGRRMDSLAWAWLSISHPKAPARFIPPSLLQRFFRNLIASKL